MLCQQPRITSATHRRLKTQSGQVVTQNELRHGFKHGHHHGLALATALPRIQRGGDGVDRMQTGDAVAQRHGSIGRLAAAILLGQPRHTGGALNQVVIRRLGGVGPCLVKAAAADMDEAGIQRLQIVIRQPQPRHGLGPHIADEHIAVFQQAQQGFFGTGIFQVQHHRLFALIGLQEDIAHARIPHGADMPHVVALGRLHLDHFSPQRGQNLRGKRPHDDGRHVHHLDASQRA